MIERFKEFYNNKFKNKSYNQTSCDDVLNTWRNYRSKIADGTLALNEYTNRDGRNNGYLTYFLEFTSNVFGSSKPGSAWNFMVKMNNDNATYHLEKIGDVESVDDADFNTADEYYKANILPLLQAAISCNSLADVKTFERNPLFQNYKGKQIIYKILVLESKVKDTDYKYLFTQMYNETSLNYLKGVFGISGEDTYMGNSYKLMRKALEELGIDYHNTNAQISYEVHDALWHLYSTRNQYVLECVNKNPTTRKIVEAMEEHKQIVLTGAPGTGKSFSATQFANECVDKSGGLVEFVQFHPSYDYSDFVEGLRPVILSTSIDLKPTFVKLDGSFKEFCRKIVMENYDDIKAKHSNEDLDFGALYTKYEIEVETKYFFIIDEINRADLSKVFGELMYGLEESYRGIKNSFQTQYQNLKSYEINSNGKAEKMKFDCFKDGFFIPLNLYIIGTMNDIDKSVEAFDFALRRRFEWIDIKAKEVCKESLFQMVDAKLIDGKKNDVKKLADRINAMNDVISTDGREFGLSDAYHIGHAYFKGVDLNDSNSLQEIFNHNIVSILKEYTRGRDKDAVNDLIQKCADALEVTYVL